MLDWSAVDAAIVDAAPPAFAFLERLVAAASTVGQEHEALVVFADEMADLGLRVNWLDVPSDIGSDPRAGVPQPVAGTRRQVVARAGPEGGRSLLLNGHIDVVPAETPQRWSSPPFVPRRDGSRLVGRGAGDMKGGFAMGALALRALLRTAPQMLTGSLSFFAAIEEECTGNGTLAAAREGVLADAVVLLEPTDLGVMIGGTGILWCDVEVDGVSTHAESAHDAVNPVDLVMRLVTDLRQWTATFAERYPDPVMAGVVSPYNLNLGQIHAGDWGSSVPATARVRLRVGYPRAWTPTEAEQRVRRQLDQQTQADGGFPSPPRLTLTGFRAAGYGLDPAHPLVEAMCRAHREVHGAPPRVFALGSTTDARTYLNDFGVPAVCYGPVATDIHGIDESVDLDSIVAGARTLARFLADWFGAAGPIR